MSSLDVFRDLAAEFSSVDEETVNRFLGYAAAVMNAEVWGLLYEQGAVYLAAHMLKSSGTGSGSASSDAGAAGPVTEIQTAQMRKQYGQLNTSALSGYASLLTTTVYGREHLRLRSALVMPVGIVA